MTGEIGRSERRPVGASEVPWNRTWAAFGGNATRFATESRRAAPPVFGGVGSPREGGRPMTGETVGYERRLGYATAAPSDPSPVVLDERVRGVRGVALLSPAGPVLFGGKAAR